MSIRRMTLGAGYRYLMSSVARMDQASRASGLTAYYAAHGAPPGRFLGAGLAGLAHGEGVISGAQVTEEHLWRMLGLLQDPLTGEQLGRPPVTERAAYVDVLGRVRRAPQPVAGFDLTFSAPKSVSVAWGLADEATRARIYAAHRRALEVVIGYAEWAVFATRTGTGGVVCEPVRGIVGAAFDHWDSRAGDPQLHTHVVVLNRVQSVSDGQWRTLDSKTLFRHAVVLSELYNGVLADLLTVDLGWGWTPETRRRSPEPKWEVTGVNTALREEFSRRSTAIDAAKEQLVAAFVAEHGRHPTSVEVLKLRQEATLATRPDKHVRPLNDMAREWQERALPLLPSPRAADHPGGERAPELLAGDGMPGAPDPSIASVSFVGSLAERNDVCLLGAADLTDEVLADTAASVVEAVSGKRATFTRANLLAETLRHLHGVRFASPVERMVAAERATGLAIERCVLLNPSPLPATRLEPLDGSVRRAARVLGDRSIYSTQDILDAEIRLLEASRSLEGPTALALITPDLAALPGRSLSPEQQAAVGQIVTSGRRLDVLVGAAGTGKSTAMAGVRAAWEAAYGPGSVVGLAPSAAAAEVLGDAVGIPTENTTKWLHEAARNPTRRAELDTLLSQLRTASPSLGTRLLKDRAVRLQAECAQWGLSAGQLVIVDEASIAGTRELDRIVAHALGADAKVLLVGDWAQLSPVTAGGAFKLLASDRSDTPHLREVRRFAHEWERETSLRLRAGDPTVVQTYLDRGRVIGGDRDTMLDAMYAAWRADTLAGRRSLMIAADASTVTDLNARARAGRVATGEVTEAGVRLADGLTAGVGDRVVTRLNQREISTGTSWVKNGDEWTVTRTHEDGSLEVRRSIGGTMVALPAAYVAEHVELAYATTAYRAQGRTVDTAHAYVAIGNTREVLYVMATRGVQSNEFYVNIEGTVDLDDLAVEGERSTSESVLQDVLEVQSIHVTATETLSPPSAAGAVAATGPGQIERPRVVPLPPTDQPQYGRASTPTTAAGIR